VASDRKPFFYRWRDRLAEEPDLTTTVRATGWRASDYGDAHGRGIFPGSVRLARDLGLTVRPGDTENRVVLKALKVLVDRGFMEKVKNGYRGQNAEYRLILPPAKGGLQRPPADEPSDMKGGL
jgi:hypothetical protein